MAGGDVSPGVWWEEQIPEPKLEKGKCCFSQGGIQGFKMGEDAFNTRVVLWGKRESWDFRII